MQRNITLVNQLISSRRFCERYTINLLKSRDPVSELLNIISILKNEHPAALRNLLTTLYKDEAKGRFYFKNQKVIDSIIDIIASDIKLVTIYASHFQGSITLRKAFIQKIKDKADPLYLKKVMAKLDKASYLYQSLSDLQTDLLPGKSTDISKLLSDDLNHIEQDLFEKQNFKKSLPEKKATQHEFEDEVIANLSEEMDTLKFKNEIQTFINEKSISLEDVDISCIEVIAKVIQDSDTLTEIDFSSGHLDDQCLIILANALVKRSERIYLLINLNLSNNKFTAQGLKKFCDILHDKVTFSHLNLSHNCLVFNTYLNEAQREASSPENYEGMEALSQFQAED